LFSLVWQTNTLGTTSFYVSNEHFMSVMPDWLFEAKYLNIGVFSTPLAFLRPNDQMKFCLF